jgi:hypothetical protein
VWYLFFETGGIFFRLLNFSPLLHIIHNADHFIAYFLSLLLFFCILLRIMLPLILFILVASNMYFHVLRFEFELYFILFFRFKKFQLGTISYGKTRK